MNVSSKLGIPLVLALVAGCGTLGGKAAGGGRRALPVATTPAEPEDPPAARGAAPVLIRGATVMTAAGPIHAPGFVLMRDGRIEAVGAGDGPEPGDATVVDAAGAFVTPGVIDAHSHMGVYPFPEVEAHGDGNEAVSPETAEVWAEHGFWPQDPGLWRAVAGGVTTVQSLPGSANLFGGRSITVKLKPATSARAMRFPGAPQGLKMACGENPKRVYGAKGGPMTRMGSTAHVRREWQKAREYERKLARYERDLAAWREKGDESRDPPEPPERNLALETLVKVLRGEILVQHHCYRADEMHVILDTAREFGFEVRAFHHALEAYKLRDRLAAENVGVATWADWWGFKMEALDGVPQNAAMLSQAGVRVVMHSDSGSEVRYLNQEAAKAVTAGRKVGIAVDENEALRWITANPAWMLGIEDQTGTLEAGKMADVVIWDRSPFSVYARAQKVFIDGELAYDRARAPRLSDFELGQSGQEVQP